MEEVNVEPTEEQVEMVKEFAQKVNRMTIGESRILRQKTGFGVGDIIENIDNEEVQATLYYLWKKKEDPTFKASDVDDLTVEEVLVFLGLAKVQEDE